MGHPDITSKRILKNLVRSFARELFGFGLAEVELLETQSQRVEDRRADLVAKVRLSDGATLILHIESQTGNEAQMPARMLRYLADILLDFPGLPVRQYLVYIGRERLTMADGFDLPRFSYRYDIIDLHAVDCEELLREGSPDAWVLAVLCDFGQRSSRAVVHDILARLQKHFAEHPARLREYVEMLEILADNRDLDLDIYEEMQMLNVNIERLASYRIGIEKGAHGRDIAIARNLLNMGLPPAKVAEATGLSLVEVDALANPEKQNPGSNS